MAWSVMATKKQKENGLVRVFLQYTNGTEIVEDNILISTLADLKRAVKQRIDRFETADNLIKNLPLNTPVDIGVVQPTQAEIDKQTFYNDMSKLDRLKQAVNLGILTGNEAIITNLVTKIKAEFKPEYL